MEEKKLIMLFLDLEGTIMEEENGEMSEEKLTELFEALKRLETNTNSTVNIHIVSPIFMAQMEKVLDKLDTFIVRFNIKNNVRLKGIQGAVAYPDQRYYINKHICDDRIFPMEISRKDEHIDTFGKLEYVRKWINSMAHKINFSIYGGNGLNDTSAMSYIKNEKKGFIICPENSHPKVKKIADYVSENSESEGIRDGINFINEQIEKRRTKTKEGETQGDTTGEGR